ncbi:MAG: hypothetical protein P3W91_001020 [Fervidobacterium sp.]|nr:hypothetical protein [Fervidobacterium sp.]
MISNVFLWIPVYIWLIIDLELKGVSLSGVEVGGFVALAGVIFFIKMVKKVIG